MLALGRHLEYSMLVVPYGVCANETTKAVTQAESQSAREGETTRCLDKYTTPRPPFRTHMPRRVADVPSGGYQPSIRIGIL